LKEADDKEATRARRAFRLNKHLKSDISSSTQLSEIEAGTTSVDGAVKTLVAAGPVTSRLTKLLAVNKVDVRMGSVT
jgi:pyruvate/oxaloacetate carboxyltransferase